jgi:uncharacterized protein
MITVQTVLRYPVKSMFGISVPSASVAEGGLAGDRGWALVDLATGKVASAKQPRLWRGLLQVRVDQSGQDGRITMTLPDGTLLTPGESGTDEALSDFLGRSVTMRQVRDPGAEVDRAVPEEVLEQGVDAEVEHTLLELSQEAPGHGFVDYAPLHLVTTATLETVAASTARTVDPRVLRANLVLSTPDLAGHVENDWLGAQVTIGDQVRLQVFLPTPRCAVPTLPHGDIAADPDILRVLSKNNRIPVEGFGVLPSAGVYAKVLTGGTVHAGDPVQIHPAG